jgi:hypothetical protein
MSSHKAIDLLIVSIGVKEIPTYLIVPNQTQKYLNGTVLSLSDEIKFLFVSQAVMES